MRRRRSCRAFGCCPRQWPRPELGAAREGQAGGLADPGHLAGWRVRCGTERTPIFSDTSTRPQDAEALATSLGNWHSLTPGANPGSGPWIHSAHSAGSALERAYRLAMTTVSTDHVKYEIAQSPVVAVSLTNARSSSNNSSRCSISLSARFPARSGILRVNLEGDHPSANESLSKLLVRQLIEKLVELPYLRRRQRPNRVVARDLRRPAPRRRG